MERKITAIQAKKVPIKQRKNGIYYRVMVLILLLPCVTTLWLTGCSAFRSPESDKSKHLVPAGGRETANDTDAPTTITSDEIVSFSCQYDCTAIEGRQWCEFSAVLQDKETLLTASVSGGAADFSYEKTVSASFMESLQALAKKYEFAGLNGKYAYTNGVLANLGTSLAVEYASGEQIKAYDNAYSLLTDDAQIDFFTLFSPDPEDSTAK